VIDDASRIIYMSADSRESRAMTGRGGWRGLPWSDLYGPHLNVPKYSDLRYRPSNTPALARPDSQAISRWILLLSSPFH